MRARFHIQFASPIIENSSDTVTTSFTASDVPCNPRNTTSSSKAPNNGREHEQHHDERRAARPAHREAELPVAERAEHADRAVGEIEDASGRVGEHQSARADRVDGAEREAGDREARKSCTRSP